MNEILSLAAMLSKNFGRLVQVTVCDTEKYLFAESTVDKSVKAGAPIGGNESYFLSDPAITRLPFVVNYKSLSGSMEKLRSSTFFFKDGEGRIQYMLSLTAKVDEFLHLRDLMNIFINGDQMIPPVETTQIDQLPKLDLSAGDLINAVIQEGQRRFGSNVERMTKLEKQSLIREMHSRGVFLIKGAVTDAARKLNYSETTVYRYLQKLDKNG